MVLRRANFEIPAQFSFQPFAGSWRFASAETLEWAEEPGLRLMSFEPRDNAEKTGVRVRIDVPDMSAPGNTGTAFMLGLGSYVSYTVIMDRASIPPDVVQPHENYLNTPDVSGRLFSGLICQKPEFKDPLFALSPGDAKKNAWIMRDEFFNLQADPQLGWDWSVRRFLNRWGLWNYSRGYTEDWASMPIRILSPSAPLPDRKRDTPDFTLVMPHLLKELREKYRTAILPSNARAWLRSHPLSLETADERPFFFVRRRFCKDAIEATITIDHLAMRRFGFCKRCGNQFEQETQHKRNFCSRRCIQAAGVKRWRAKQKLEAKRRKNAKS